jgi:Uma2 family endonuclease
MADPARKTDRRYTYRDYASWPDDERWELIDGGAWSMSPAPSTPHQRLLGRLFVAFSTWQTQQGGECEVFVSAYDVLLPSDPSQDDDDVDTVVQPDLTVICDAARITHRGCRGAPHLVVEILSPSTGHKDQLVKHELYARHGVREYWVLDPGNRCLRIYTLDAPDAPARFGEPATYTEDALAVSATLPGLAVSLAELFRPPL